MPTTPSASPKLGLGSSTSSSCSNKCLSSSISMPITDGLRRRSSKLRMLSMELMLRWESGLPVRARANGEVVPVEEGEMEREEREGEKAVRRVWMGEVVEVKEKRLERVVDILMLV